MGNGARHGLGVVAGLLFTPLILAGLTFGAGRVITGMRELYLPWIGLPALVVTAVLMGFAVGSRMSPLASLLPGLTLTILGALPALTFAVPGLPLSSLTDLAPREFNVGLQELLYSGLMLVIGVVLLIASLFPSRWRARPRPQDWSPQPYQPAPQEAQHQQMPYNPNQPTAQYWPPEHQQQGPEDTTRPFHRD
jgi:hypothetical protein